MEMLAIADSEPRQQSIRKCVGHWPGNDRHDVSRPPLPRCLVDCAEGSPDGHACHPPCPRFARKHLGCAGQLSVKAEVALGIKDHKARRGNGLKLFRCTLNRQKQALRIVLDAVRKVLHAEVVVQARLITAL